MSNILNIYDPEDNELVLANLYFYPKDYNDAARIACEQGAEFVHGICPDDIRKYQAGFTAITDPKEVLSSAD